MTTIFGKRENEDTPFLLLRWTARILGLAVVILFVLFAFGEDGITRGITGTEFVGLIFFPLGISIGFLLGWWNELWGGSLSVACLAGFYLIFGLALTGRFPSGPFFLIFAIPGFLLLIYGLLRLTVVQRERDL